jgi:hypothetical protein
VRNWRFLLWLGAALVAVFVLGALTIVAFTRTTHESRRFTGHITKVMVVSERGAVSVRPGPANQATVAYQRKFVFTGPVVDTSVSAGILTVTAKCPFMAFISCSADFQITVPAGVAVDATAQRGLLTVDGITGRVFSNSESGSFLYRGTSQSVTAYSLNGDITARFLSPPHFVHARSETGRVLVVIPQNPYRLTAESGIGTHEIIGLTPVPSSPHTVYASSGDNDARIQRGG